MSDATIADTVFDLTTFLNRDVVRDASALNAVRAHLQAGRAVAIHDALEVSLAEQVHQSLDACDDWRVYEGCDGPFHYHHHNLYDEQRYPAPVAWCQRIFGSAATRSFASTISGRDCSGPTTFSASWYLPGDHSLPHNDNTDSATGERRQVAFVWHLTKGWRPEWGGALYWCPSGRYIPPAFNTLILFNVGAQSDHFVTQVSPYAQGKRLAINGWWTGTTVAAAEPPQATVRLESTSVSIEEF